MVLAPNLVQVLDYKGGRTRPGGAAPQSDDIATDLGVGALFDQLLDAVVIATLSTGRIVMWNPAAEKLFGYTAQEAIGKPIEMLMPEPIAHIHRAGLERYVRTGHGLIIDADSPVEMPARTKGGDVLRVELTLSELQSSEGERFAMAMIRDATRHRQLELTTLELTQARIARAEAEGELAARDELLDAVEATLESATTSDELQRLGRSLADLRRLRSGELRARPVDVDLVDLIYAGADSARRRAQGRRLLVHAPPSAPASCDPVQLRQILDQVLDELIRRSSEGGRIELRVDVLSPQLVQLSVRADTNCAALPRPLGVNLLISRMLIQHQGGTFHTELSSSGSLEVIMTAPGSPQSMRRRPSRPRRLGRAASLP
jgi:PAS domain S-box-containing protein